MKKTLILNKNYLSYWLRQIRKEYELIAPMNGLPGDYVFKTVEQIHDISLDCGASAPLPKEFVFPQLEEMFSYSKDRVNDRVSCEKMVIFGVKPCDMSAINLVESFYRGMFNKKYSNKHPSLTFNDWYFTKRRDNTVFIVIGCGSPEPTCFCNSLGSGPFLEKGFDIQLSDLGDRYLVQTGTQKGKDIVSPYKYLFEDAGKNDNDDQYELVLSTIAKFEKRVNLNEVRDKILANEVPDMLWEWVAKRCFECGGCVYECPVCTCFNIVDRAESKDSGMRIRIWDTCFFKGFTRMAGGNVPAEKKCMRTKRWWYHKLIYYPEQFGRFGCVGCGRCTITCPGRIDIATVSHRIKVWQKRKHE
jgi:ferredoxin